MLLDSKGEILPIFKNYSENSDVINFHVSLIGDTTPTHRFETELPFQNLEFIDDSNDIFESLFNNPFSANTTVIDTELLDNIAIPDTALANLSFNNLLFPVNDVNTATTYMMADQQQRLAAAGQNAGPAVGNAANNAPDGAAPSRQLSVNGMTDIQFSGEESFSSPEQFLLQMETKLKFIMGPCNRNNVGPAVIADYESRLICLTAMSLIGEAKKWYYNQTFADDITWDDFKRLFIAQFTSKRFKYQARAKAQELEMGPNESIRTFARRIEQLVQNGWKDESPECIILKTKELFASGIPANLRKKAHSMIMCGRIDQNGVRVNFTFAEIVNAVDDLEIVDRLTAGTLHKTINEDQIFKRVMNEVHKINAISSNDDPNNKTRQGPTRFCKYCRGDNHTIAFCFKKKRADAQAAAENSGNHASNSNTQKEANQTFEKTFNPGRGSRGNSRGRGRGRGSSNQTKTNKNTAFNKKSFKQNYIQEDFQDDVIESSYGEEYYDNHEQINMISLN